MDQPPTEPQPVQYAEEHINLLLEISKIYKIMSLLQPETDELLNRGGSNEPGSARSA